MFRLHFLPPRSNLQQRKNLQAITHKPRLTGLNLAVPLQLHKPPVSRFIFQLDLRTHPHGFAVPGQLGSPQPLCQLIGR
ncbi:hypothetical protein LINPERPRIM_LOCUS39632 [Linum perenne]